MDSLNGHYRTLFHAGHKGQRVVAFTLEAFDGAVWRTVAEGTTIGHKRLHRFPKVTAANARLTISKAKACPTIRALGVYLAPGQ